MKKVPYVFLSALVLAGLFLMHPSLAAAREMTVVQLGENPLCRDQEGRVLPAKLVPAVPFKAETYRADMVRTSVNGKECFLYVRDVGEDKTGQAPRADIGTSSDVKTLGTRGFGE